jgi:hypothetical protein
VVGAQHGIDIHDLALEFFAFPDAGASPRSVGTLGAYRMLEK